MKTILILLMSFLFGSLSAQDYTWTHGSTNSAGGHQANILYSNTTAFGEYVIGEVNNSSFDCYLGFLFPTLDKRLPIITSIDDVPYDQGRQVQIVWDKCGYDDFYTLDTYYSVWRLDENFTDLKVSVRNRDEKDEQIQENLFTEPWQIVEQYTEHPDEKYYWQRDSEVWTFMDTIPALQFDEDSNSVDINYSIFKVVYHDLYEYFESNPDSGYSVDNIAPDETKAYITLNGSNMNLSWDEVENGTFQGNSYPEVNGIWYKIYAGDSPDFVCDEAHLIDTVTNLNYDYPIGSEERKFFKVVVSDQP